MLALDRIHDNSIHKGRYTGHGLNNIKSFRLTGIYFSRGGHRRGTDLVNIGPSEDLIIDNCVFEAPATVAFANMFQYKKPYSSIGLTINGSNTIQVRHCIFGSSAVFYIEDQTQLSIKHNWFQPSLTSQLIFGTYLDEFKERCQVEIKANVFSQNRFRSIFYQLPETTELDLTVQQNTFHGGESFKQMHDGMTLLRRGLLILPK